VRSEITSAEVIRCFILELASPRRASLDTRSCWTRPKTILDQKSIKIRKVRCVLLAKGCINPYPSNENIRRETDLETDLDDRAMDQRNQSGFDSVGWTLHDHFPAFVSCAAGDPHRPGTSLNLKGAANSSALESSVLRTTTSLQPPRGLGANKRAQFANFARAKLVARGNEVRGSSLQKLTLATFLAHRPPASARANYSWRTLS